MYLTKTMQANTYPTTFLISFLKLHYHTYIILLYQILLKVLRIGANHTRSVVTYQRKAHTTTQAAPPTTIIRLKTVGKILVFQDQTTST